MRDSTNETDARTKLVVIMGAGRVGVSAAVSLSDEGHIVHLLDLSEDALELLPRGKVEDGQIVPLVADGTLEKDLRKAATQDADIFIAVSGRDASNAMAAQMAKHVFRVSTVICRINDPTRKEMYSQLGLVTISATRMVTDMVLDASRA